MSTKIDGSGERYPAAIARTAPARSAAQTQAAGQSGSAPVRDDALSLTRDAQMLQQARQAAADAPAVDQQRIDAIRQSLRDGSYRIDAKVIAARLLKTEWELS